MDLDVSQDILTTGQSAMTQLTRRAQRLYSLPGAALQVIQLAGNPDVSASSLKEAIETDPVLTAKILAVVNSSLFGQREKIVSLHRAIAILGSKPLRLLVLGLSLPRNLLEVEADLLSNYWRMCLSKSVAAKEISRRFYGGKLEDEVFITALLQDIGMLILIQQLQTPYIDLLTQARDAQADVLETETRAMGFDHTCLSANLLEQWRLPPQIVQAVRLPLHCETWPTLGSDDQLLAEMLSWADLYGRFMSGSTGLLSQVQESARRQWHVGEEQLDGMLRELDDHVRALAKAFGVDARSWPDLTLLMQSALSALSQAAEDSVREWLGQHSTMQQALARVRDEEQASAAGDVLPSNEPQPAQAQKPAKFVRPTLSVTTFRASSSAQLLARVAAAADSCRRGRYPLSLILVQVDRHDEMLALGGIERLKRLIDFVERAILECSPNRSRGISLGNARFALVLENCDRAESLQVARYLADCVRNEQPACALPGVAGVTLSIGVASTPVPPRNFVPEDLVAASHRCLNAAVASGGSMTKSIDLI